MKTRTAPNADGGPPPAAGGPPPTPGGLLPNAGGPPPAPGGPPPDAGEPPSASKEPPPQAPVTASEADLPYTAPEEPPDKTKVRTEEPSVPAADGTEPQIPVADGFPTSITVHGVIAVGGQDPLQTCETIDYVHERLTRYLQHPPAGAKTPATTGVLATQKPLDIGSMKAGDSLMSFREACKYSSAVNSLVRLALCEGVGDLFWFNAKAPNVWKGARLGGSANSPAQLNAAKTLFSHDQLVAPNPDNQCVRILAVPIFLAGPSRFGARGASLGLIMALQSDCWPVFR